MFLMFLIGVFDFLLSVSSLWLLLLCDTASCARTARLNHTLHFSTAQTPTVDASRHL